MFKNLLKFIVMAPLLMATTCEDDLEENTIVYNVYKTQVTPEYSFSMNDTIWISGKISSKVYDEAVNDSIFLENPHTDEFSIHKFIEPTEASNWKIKSVPRIGKQQ